MNLRFSWNARLGGLTGLWLIMALGPVGCGGPFTGEVTGTVQYKGKPLPGGIVTIMHPDGRIGKGDIQPDGTYSIPAAPGGDCKVTVYTVKPLKAPPKWVQLPGGNPGKDYYPAGEYVPIPKKYSDASTSGLKLDVKRGSQTFPIELTD